jgi:uncharacterized Ntn-hydrolase superfamily protein
LLLAGVVLGLSHSAHATYSIVGVDTARGEVGGSGTSCLGGQDVYIIYGSVPGAGVVHAQASFNREGRDRAVALLMQGVAPNEIVDAITDASFDRNASVRQYAVADVTGRVRGFTGTGTGVFAGDRQGAPAGFAYSVQGNILTGERVLTQAAAGFEAGGCDLAERLMLALEAGADGGEGDSRCTDDGIPSDSAFVQVDREGEAPGDYLALRVPTSGDESPLPALRASFTNWRAQHPCPSPVADAGTDDAGMTDAGPDDAGTSDAGSGDAGTQDAGVGDAGIVDAGTADAGAGREDVSPANADASCGCRTAGHVHTHGAAWLLALACVSLSCCLRRRFASHRVGCGHTGASALRTQSVSVSRAPICRGGLKKRRFRPGWLIIVLRYATFVRLFTKPSTRVLPSGQV